MNPAWGLSSTIKFTEQKNSAYDIWPFVWPVEMEEDVPVDLWPDDYDNHSKKRPDTPLIGCKFCTQFG